MVQKSKPQKKPDTDNLSIYDLPTLNSVIDHYELPQGSNENSNEEKGNTFQ